MRLLPSTVARAGRAVTAIAGTGAVAVTAAPAPVTPTTGVETTPVAFDVAGVAVSLTEGAGAGPAAVVGRLGDLR